ncbi:hormogonium polysaccharide biosynthesis protein HpsA [Leptothoe spongobia]|uniref:Uncharacterized protein n=1 Tax=Leptothoe spongobia TAU-MAC 1115 TaxID=1967444 RepID=A0A947DEH9_9CYAN|nr:hormogonium polysaccharide biosynthesis protein HpsA [Leptothoe spongobia]MBT9315563.1 hypothetical protein [Leptothoe spongobia TAU-MAC 1115]
MSTPKRSRVSNRHLLFLQFLRLPKRFMAWLLRLIFIGARITRTNNAGFVLPTTVLLLLVVSLTVGGLSFRSFSRVERTIALREQKVVDEIAAPAIDRARAKIEYMFANDGRVADKRPPSSQDLIEALLANAGGANDPYTLPDETQLDIVPGNVAPTVNTTGLEPAWAFDFQGRNVVYSILVQSDNGIDADMDGEFDITIQSKVDADGDGVDEKVQSQVTRNGPISAGDPGGNCPIGSLAGSGWYEVGGGSRLEKNIQVNVLSATGDGVNRAVNAGEYQQVRVAQRGSRWGAWFRYDLDIFPGSDFRWNGAMHTEANLITGQSFKAYLVSAQSSCINDPASSEISLNSIDNDGNGSITDANDFRGELIGGSILNDDFELKWGNNGTNVEYHSSRNFAGNVPVITELGDPGDTADSSNDSVDTTDKPSDIAIDPVNIFTKDGSSHLTPANYRDDPAWANAIATNADRNGRVELDQDDTVRPFLDDGYRADGRYGPKFRYDSQQALDEQDGVAISPNLSGQDIPLSHDALVVDDAANEVFGLDGYWERRAIKQGLRVVVGQRLELGNSLGWGGSDDPLYPQKTVQSSLIDTSVVAQEPGEVLQQRSLRDNLAAVQGMIVYHYTEDDGELPYMCMASTVHPGTDKTLENSRTFTQYPANPSTNDWKIDFLNGVGTNGWEFDFQSAYATPANFASAVVDTQPLGKALRNLAYFAGDPLGGAPSFPAVQGTENITFSGSNANTANLVHPYPYLSMWGDFSILRRIFDTYGVTTTAQYDDLSPADKSTLHSSACSLGMLAYNLQSVQDEVTAGSTDPVILELRDQIERDRTYGFNTTALGLATTVKYPALYYLFPIEDHDQIGVGATTPPSPQPLTEEYFTEDLTGTDVPYISQVSGAAITGGINDATTIYAAVNPADIDLAPLAPGSFNQPKASVVTDADTGVAPDFTDTTAYLTSGQNNRLYFSKNYINANGTFYATTFLDKSMMDGRELMSSRVTDLDIGNLTLNTVGTSGIKWIPERGGIVYTFREDAVREDSIVRPKHTSANWDDDIASATANNCRVFNNLLTNAECYMDYVPTDGSQRGTFDPPLNPTTGISVKPVDLVADPMRRPNGFRIFNGANLNRSDDIEAAGMTLVTDNSLYIKGDLNLHETKTGTPAELQEFTGGSFLADADFATANEATARTNFYGRLAADLDSRFANPAEDKWRPVEIFADAITILSDTYLDGVVEDAFIKRRGTAEGTPIINSSFTNFHRPRHSSNRSKSTYQREDEEVVGSTNVDLPIRFDRNGVLKSNQSGTYAPFPNGTGNNTSYIYFDYPANVGEYRRQRRSEAITADLDANATRVNALLIAGIVPSRPAQPYGGLHNFPRLLEYWKNKPLYISGGFFQLNFSTQATAPYDQDAWSPGDTSNSDLFIGYYNAADRIWGYDVALQYVSSAPIAERFITLGRPRNEYYRQVDLEDPYVKPLRCPTDAGGNYVQVDPQYATLADCQASL